MTNPISAGDIKVTAEMLQAGADCLSDLDGASVVFQAEEAFRAMMEVALASEVYQVGNEPKKGDG